MSPALSSVVRVASTVGAAEHIIDLLCQILLLALCFI